jgi:putative membrane protein
MPHDTPEARLGYAPAVFAHVGAFLVRLAVSAVVLMLAVGWVSPGNRRNTFGRAALVSFALSLAWYVTLARFAWFLLLPWLLYVVVWLVVVTLAYGLSSLRALLLALALAFLSFLVSALFGLRPL